MWHYVIPVHDCNINDVKEYKQSSFVPHYNTILKCDNECNNRNTIHHAVTAHWPPIQKDHLKYRNFISKLFRRKRKSLQDSKCIQIHTLPAKSPQHAGTASTLKTADPTIAPTPKSLFVIKVPTQLINNSGLEAAAAINVAPTTSSFKLKPEWTHQKPKCWSNREKSEEKFRKCSFPNLQLQIDWMHGTKYSSQIVAKNQKQ